MDVERILPRAFPAGGRLAVISPAGAPKEPLVRLGMERLTALGYEPVLFPSALKRGPIYYAGTIQERLHDLHAAFANEAIDAVICTRGGWGTAELLPYLKADLIRKYPKPFLGYSDHTTLHAWFAREVGLVTFYAPMVSADFSRRDSVEEAVDLASWTHALSGTQPWSLQARDGLRVLKAGTAVGTLFGGCISIIAESLGTPYAMVAPRQDGILFVEDVGVHPYQWDRHLLHLRYSGLMDRVQGIVFGDMEQCVADAQEYQLLEAAILHNLRDFRGPILIGLRCGHVNGANISLPLGVRVALEATAEPCINILESAVQ